MIAQGTSLVRTSFKVPIVLVCRLFSPTSILLTTSRSFSLSELAREALMVIYPTNLTKKEIKEMQSSINVIQGTMEAI